MAGSIELFQTLLLTHGVSTLQDRGIDLPSLAGLLLYLLRDGPETCFVEPGENRGLVFDAQQNKIPVQDGSSLCSDGKILNPDSSTAVWPPQLCQNDLSDE